MNINYILYFSELNIYKAMKINKIHSSLILLLGISILITSCSDSLSDTTDGRLRYWISTLSSDEFEGRAPGTEGGQLTKNFISKTFQDFDLDLLMEVIF